jgi:hypothetical protein
MNIRFSWQQPLVSCIGIQNLQIFTLTLYFPNDSFSRRNLCAQVAVESGVRRVQDPVLREIRREFKGRVLILNIKEEVPHFLQLSTFFE